MLGTKDESKKKKGGNAEEVKEGEPLSKKAQKKAQKEAEKEAKKEAKKEGKPAEGEAQAQAQQTRHWDEMKMNRRTTPPHLSNKRGKNKRRK